MARFTSINAAEPQRGRSAVFAVKADDSGSALRLWWPVIAGYLVMFGPTYYELAQTFWREEFGAHGPVILAIFLWLLWRQRWDFSPGPCDRPMPRIGALMFLGGLFLYVLGRTQGLLVFEVGSQIPLLLGLILFVRGMEGVRALWFPVSYLLFLVPWPGSLLDAVLLPLKQFVSLVVDELLYAFGYPVARSGVVLTVGPYQLLIANACAGLNSMIALTAVGTLFVYLAGHHGRAHGWILLAGIFPVALLANLLRVMALVLITYHLGDAAGQNFHDIAGYMEILFAFGSFMALYSFLLGRIERTRDNRDFS